MSGARLDVQRQRNGSGQVIERRLSSRRNKGRVAEVLHTCFFLTDSQYLLCGPSVAHARPWMKLWK